jgi:hypothetical protein
MQRTPPHREEANEMPAFDEVDAVYVALVLLLIVATMAAYGLLAATV